MPKLNLTAVRAFLTVLIATAAGALAAQPTLDWQAHYEHIVPSPAEPGSGDSILGKKCMVVDAAGNTYVTGRSRNNGGRDDYATVKYDANGVQLWRALYNGPANLLDYGYAIALDGNGDVVVTGRSESAAGSWDFATVKYNGTTGAQVWASRYGAPGVNDHARALAIDASNDVYVTGYATIGGQRDFATVKYDGTTGATAWTGGSFVNGAAIWNSTTGSEDEAFAIAVNAAGVYVTGRSYNGTFYDYATIAYDPAGSVQWGSVPFNNNGALLWNSTANRDDNAYAIALGSSGEVYVTGFSFTGSNFGYATVKYNSAGAIQWGAVPGNDNGAIIWTHPANGTRAANDVIVDGAGDVIITGYTYNGANYDFATIKYNSAGAAQWTGGGFINGAVIWNNPTVNNWDFGRALAVDSSNNIFVTGDSSNGTNNDYATIKYTPAGAPAWSGGSFINGAVVMAGTGNGADEAYAVVTRGTDAYITGRSWNGSNNDYATIKYDAAGAEVWNTRFIGGTAISIFGGNDAIRAKNCLKVDAAGNVYAIGRSSNGSNSDYSTVKYDSSGVEQWRATWNSSGNSDDRPTALAVNASGDVYVTGYSIDAGGSGGWNYATIKYNGATGATVWGGAGFDNGAAVWNSSANNYDEASALALDASGDVYVTGNSIDAGGSGGWNYATIKYNGATGATVWSGAAPAFDNGAAVWDSSANSTDQAFAVALDASGDVYVTGRGYHAGGWGSWNYATIKYNGATGATVWSGAAPAFDNGAAVWNSSANSDDEAHALALDASGEVYVTGYSIGAGGSGGQNYATIKYNGATGATVWSGAAPAFDNGAAVWNGSGNNNDEANALALDASGGVYVTGKSVNAGGSGGWNYATVKYNGTTGATVWTGGSFDNGAAVWNGSGNNNDEANALALDASGNIYVTGQTYNGSNFDFATVKYSTNGTELWAQTQNSGGGDYAYAVATAPGNKVVVAGTAPGAIPNGQSFWILQCEAGVSPAGAEFRVNTTTADSQETSPLGRSVALDADGDFVITWMSHNQDGSGYGIYAQRYDNTGAAVGGEFQVNSYTTNDQYYPSVALDADGDFVITWTSNGQDGSGSGVYAQRYDNTGAAVGGEFQVNSYTTSSQQYPSVALDADGDFVITWTSNGQDGSGNGIYAQRYDNTGAAVGGEFQVNSYTTSDQYHPSVALDADGDFVITWMSNGQDGSGWGVYAQRYTSTFGSTGPTPPAGDPVQVWVDPSWSTLNYGDDPSGPATFYGWDAFATAQAAVDGADVGGTVTLAAGTYSGLTINKAVSLIGAGVGVTIIEGASPALTVSAAVSISGATYTTATDDPTVLILSGGDLTIDTSSVTESTAFTRPAFEVQSGGAVTFGAGVSIDISGTGSLIDNQAAGAIDLVTNAVVLTDNAVAFADNFAIEDAIAHALDNATVGLVTWVANNVYVTTNTLGIQAGVNAATAGDTVNVQAGSYDEQVVVNKALTLEGPNMGVSGTALRGAEAILTVTAGTNTNPLLEVTVAGVTIDGLRFESDAAQSAGGIFALTAGSGTGLIVRNNVILATAGTSADGVLVNDAGATPTIARNLIDSGAGDFDTALRLVGAGGTVGGAALDAGNSLEGLSADFVSVNAGAALSIRRNSFNSTGAVVDDPVAVVTVRENFFTPATSAPQGLLLRYVNQAAVNVLSNAFTGHENVAVLSGASSGVTLDGNSFTPGGAATNFTHVLVSSSFPTASAPPTGATNSITLINNSFTAATGTGRALDFQNHDDTAVWGPVVIGTSGNENSFETALAGYLRLQLTPFLAPTFAGHGSLTAGNFTFNLNAADNLFHVNPGPGVVPTSMSAGERATLENKTFHKVDNSGVGVVNYGFNYLPTLTSVSNLGPTNEGVELDIPYATLLGASNAADVDGTIAALIVSGVTGNGVLEITPFAGVRGPVSTPLQLVTTGDVLHWAPTGDLNDLNNSGPVLAFNVIARDNLGADSAPTVGVSINVTAVNDAPVTNTPAAITLDEDTTDTVTFSFTDVDVGETGSTGIVRFELTATSGNLTLATLVGLTSVSGGSGTTAMEYTGSPTDVNNALVNVQYAPSQNFSGSATIVFTIYDEGNVGLGGSQSDFVNVGVTVDPVNDAPVVNSNAGLTLNEGATGAAISQLLLEHTDVDNLPGELTYTLDTIPAFGTLRLATVALAQFSTFTQADINAGDLTYDHDGSENFSLGFDFTVTDNGTPTGSTTGTFNITVTPVNDAPVATIPAPLTLAEDGSVNFALLFTDADITQGADEARVFLQASSGILNLTTPLGGTITFNGPTADGTKTLDFQGDRTEVLAAIATVTYTPDGDFNGTDTITFTVDDLGNTGLGGAQTDTELLGVTVTAVNDAPVASGSAPITLDEDSSENVSFSFTDVDVNETGTTNTVRFILSATDGDLTITDDSALTLINGANGSTSMEYSGSPADVLAALSGPTDVTYAPHPNYNGPDTIVFTIHDEGNVGSGGSQSHFVNVGVTVDPLNDAPVLTTVNPSLLPTADEDTLRTITYAQLFGASDAADVDGDPIGFLITSVSANTLSLFIQPANVAVTPGTTIVTSLDTLEWTPATHLNNDTNSGNPLAAFAVRAHDGLVDSGTDVTVAINTNALNDAPSFTAVDPTVDEDAGLVTITDWAASANFSPGGGSDEGTQAALNYNVQSFTNGPLFIGGSDPVIAFSGGTWNLSFESGPNLNGSSVITVRVTDDGPSGLGDVNSADILFTITVNAINDEPTFTQGAGFEIGPYATDGAKVVANWATGMSPGGGIDEAGQILTFAVSPPTVVVAPMNFAVLPIVNAGTGELTFEIAPGSTGIATFSVTLEDDGAQAPPPNDHVSPAITLIIAMRQGQVYVDLDDSALNYGDTPTLGNFFGIDAFAGVQLGLDNVADGGSVDVDGNATPYGTALISRDVTLNLAPTAVLLGDGAPALGVNAGVAQVNGGVLRQTSGSSDDPCVFLVGGTVDLDAVIMEQNTDDDALRIDGASVTLDGVEIRESSSGTRRAIDLQTGSLDANTGAANTLRILGTGTFINNVTAGGVDALNNLWDNGGTSLDPTDRADGLAIEDLVNHALDSAAFGLVRWDVDSLYVTQTSGSIQRGINNSNAGDTLEVGVGSFAEYLVVDRSLSIYGEQRDNDADIRFAAFNPLIESVVVPFDTLGANDLFRVTADSVEINGFVLDGATAGTNGRSGITNDDGIGGVIEIELLLSQHNIVRNMTDAGVSLANNGTADANTVRFNVFAGLDGSAVRASDDSFIDVIDNTMFVPAGAIGIEVRDFSIDRNGATDIRDNRIDVGAGAVAIELVALDLTSTSPITVVTNTIQSVGGAGASSGTTGIRVASLFNDMDVQFTGNTLAGATVTDEFEFGFTLFEIETPDLLVSGGSIEAALTGVLIDSAMPTVAAGAGSVVVLSGVAIGQTTPGNDGVVVRAINQGVIPFQPVGIDLVNCDITGLLSGVVIETDASGAYAGVSMDGGSLTGSGLGGHAVEITGATAIGDIANAVLAGDADAVRVTDGSVSVSDSDLSGGVTGLHVRSGASVLLFRNNALTGAGNGVLVRAFATAVGSIFDNSITVAGNGLENQSVLLINAERNWWGDTTGPTHASNLGGTGVAVVDGGAGTVDFSPWWASGTNQGGTPGFAGGGSGPSLFGDDLHAIPTELEWSIQPPNGSAGLALTTGPRVRARDSNDILGYNWDAANSDAFLVFSNNPTGASLQGNPVIQAAHGFAHFTNVAVSTGGVGFTVFVIGDYGLASLANSPVSLPFNIDNLVPSLSGITPDFAHEGAGSVTIQVDGGNFNSTTVVRFDGADRPTFFINPGRVLAALTSQDTATLSIGTHLIDVRNPSPGGGVTGTLPFIVNDIPNSIGLANSLVAENLASGAPVDTFTTSDTADTHSYTLAFGSGSQDNGSFSLSLAGALTTAVSFDFETKSSYSIRVRSTDSFGAWIEQVFTINVTNVNEAPTGVADSYSVNEDVTLNVNAVNGVLANDGDVDAATTLSATQIGGLPVGAQSLTLNPNGSFDLVPSPQFNGMITFQYSVADNGAPALNDGPITVTVTVNPVNDAPTFVLSGSTSSNEDAGAQSVAAAGSFDAGATNESDTVLAYEIVANSNAALFSTQPTINTAGQLSYTSAPDANGSAVLDVRVRDTGGTANGGVDVSAVQQITITINPVNDAPSFTVSPANSIITRNEDSGLTTIVNWASFTAGPANESGQGVSQYNISNVSNSGLFVGLAPSVASNGTLTFTPAAQAFGSSTFDVSVTDDSLDPGVNTSATQTFTIIINPANDAPTLTSVSTFLGGTEDTPFVITFGNLQTAADDFDADGDPVHFRIDSLVSGSLTMNGNPVVPGTTVFSIGSLTWTPPAHANGPAVAAFTLLAWDGLLPSAAPVTVTVELAAVNDVPVLVVNAGATVLEGASVGITQALLEATDVEDAASGLTFELVAVTGNGTLFNGATPLISGATFTQDNINLGQLSYTHNDTETSSDFFTFFVVDTGAPVGRLPAVGNLTFSISVTPDNDAPTLTSVNTLPGGVEDTALSITWNDLSAASVGLGDPENDPISFRVQALTSGTLTKNGNPVVAGVTTVASGESLVWTPVLDANGTLGAFTVVAFDGALDSGTSRQVSVAVTPVNDRPSISVPTPAVTSEDSGPNTIPGWATMLPGGGADELGQLAVNWNVVNVGNPGLFSAQPVVTLPNGDLQFSPTANAFGVSTIDVEVTDDGAPNVTSFIQTFTITVNNVNDAPTLSFISTIFGGPEDSPITVPFAILQGAANESDIDSSPVNFLLESVSNGTATLNTVPITGPTVFTASDTLVWTPTADFNGTLTGFNVRAWDGMAQSTTVLPLRIFVEPVNDEPDFAAGNPPASLEDAGPVTVLGWATFDAGPPNEDTTQAVLNYTVSSVVITSGTLAFLSGPTIDNNGNLHYEAAPDTNGTATFSAQVRDTGGTASLGDDTSPLNGPFTITVTAVNDAPTFTATGNPSAVDEDSGAATVPGWITGVDFGPSDEDLSQGVLDWLIDQVSDPLMFSVQPDVVAGTLTYTPAADAFGTVTFRVRVQDNGGGTAPDMDTSAGQTFTITINPVNDAPSVTGGSSSTVAEDAGAQLISNFVGINPGPGNESGQTALAYSVQNLVLQGGLTFSTSPTINTAGALSFQTSPDSNGSATFQVQVQDNGGGGAPNVDVSALSIVFTITVTPVNDAPTLTSVSVLTGAFEDTPFTITYAMLLGASNAADIDSAPVNFRVAGVTTGSLTKNGNPVIPGSTTLAATESLVWQTSGNQNGTLNAFTVTAWDGSLASSPPVQVQVNATPINDEPSFTKGTNITVAWDQGPQSIPGWASAISAGPADESSQVLTFNITGNTNAALFSVQPSVTGAGTLTFTPNLNVAGTTSISLRLMDNGGVVNAGDDDTSPDQSFTITISTAGEIDISRGATPVPDGNIDSVGATVPVLTPMNLTYLIENTGNGLLQLTNTTTPVVVLNTTNADAWVTHQPASTLVTTTSSSFVVHVVPLTTGPFSVDIFIDSTDADENPYDIIIGGTAVDAPDIGLARGFHADIPSGATDNLGVIPTGIATGFTYVVRNQGTIDLTFGSPAANIFSATNCAVAFTAPAGPVAASATDNLQLDVTPTVTGVFSFVLEINSNDPDEDPFTLFIQGSASGGAQPELELFGRRVLAPMDTENVGLIPSGSNTTFLYEVRNIGASPLTVANPVSVGNTLNCVAVVTVTPGGNVAPGSMTVLGIDVQPIAPGPFQFDFTLITNDADESPLPVTVMGQSTASVVPEIAVDRDGTPIPSGGTDDIGDLPLGVFSTFIYRVRNEGTSTLTVNRPVTVSGQSNCELFIVAFPDVSIAPQDDSLLVVGIRPLGTGALSAILSISNNDSNEGNYLIDIIGTGPEADIRVESPEFSPLASGGTFTVGGAKAGSISVMNLWVRNVGTGDLNIIGVSASAEVNCSAVVVSAGASPVAPGSSTMLTLDVTPSAAGTFSFTLTITSNDPDTGNYVLFVTGNAAKSGKGGKKSDSGCSTGEGGTSWLLLLAALSALVVATRGLRARRS
ncbi:MAG: tandem-95 repeat protein [Planctomycetes bacterium]|nr:tandem-95 repeat protein [Planctomycetota bacterium]